MSDAEDNDNDNESLSLSDLFVKVARQSKIKPGDKNSCKNINLLCF